MKQKENFLKSTGLAAAPFGSGIANFAMANRPATINFKISLAGGLERPLVSGRMDQLDFAKFGQESQY